MLKEALLYKKLDNNRVSCFLCSHRCLITDNKFGICGVRQNISGVLYTHAYGGLVANNIDPIEKKPIFHMLPGSKSYSIATYGCNFRCSFCQNWQISQKNKADSLSIGLHPVSPREVVSEAKKYNCKSISYTYTEPTIFFEYAYEIAKIAKKEGLYNIFVTNGYMTTDALVMIAPYLDAANVDLKFFKDDSYLKTCGAHLEPVLETIRLMHKLKVWIEITTLIIPSQNDSEEELKSIANFLAQTDKGIPWHISRFHPDYEMSDVSATPIAKLKEAYKIALDAGLRYVYTGNIPQEENTFCYSCGKCVIRRFGFEVLENKLKDSRCSYCASTIDGVAL